MISKINVMWCDVCSILACRGLLNWTGHCEVKTKILVVRLQPMKDLPGRICEVIKENIQKLNDFKLGIALTQMMSHQTDQMNSCSERQRADRLTYWFIHLLNSLLLLHAADKKSNINFYVLSDQSFWALKILNAKIVGSSRSEIIITVKMTPTPLYSNKAARVKCFHSTSLIRNNEKATMTNENKERCSITQSWIVAHYWDCVWLSGRQFSCIM